MGLLQNGNFSSFLESHSQIKKSRCTFEVHNSSQDQFVIALVETFKSLIKNLISTFKFVFPNSAMNG